MSMPARKEEADKIEALIEANTKAGGWKYGFLPNSFEMVQLEGPPEPEELLKIVGDQPVGKKS